MYTHIYKHMRHTHTHNFHICAYSEPSPRMRAHKVLVSERIFINNEIRANTTPRKSLCDMYKQSASECIFSIEHNILLYCVFLRLPPLAAVAVVVRRRIYYHCDIVCVCVRAHA